MKTAFLILIVLVFSRVLPAQNRLQVMVQNEDDRQPLAGANVYFEKLHIGASTDINGLAQIAGIPNGRHTLVVSYVGYKTKKIVLTFPNKKQKQSLTVLLESAPFSSEQIVVTSTRNNSIVAKTPVRIEVLGKEEVNEEIAILPGNISKFLGESSSIITQRTSPISGAVSFRLQGLPARYTQMLKDGFPDFSGLASGFSPLQIPPLDLKQIEIVRGSYSTLFANGAVAGIVNLVTQKPSARPKLDILLNRTNRQGTDVNAFYSARYGRTGLTLLATQSLQNAVDVDKDGFSDIPRFRQATINPRLFFDFNKTTSLMIGLNSFFEDRSGGDMQALEHGADSLHAYTEVYGTKRLGLNLRFRKQLRDSGSVTIKTSVQDFNQSAAIPNTYFNGSQMYAFTEASYFRPVASHKLVAGLSFIHHRFEQQNATFNSFYNNRFTTVGVFAQDDWNFAPHWTAHGGLRWDYRSDKQSFFLPNAALLFEAGSHLTIRLSGGFGYSVPTLFDVAPRQAYFTYRIHSGPPLKPEKSRDIAFDATYRFASEAWALSVNQAFYATRINRSLFALPEINNTPIQFNSEPIKARGAETHLVLNLKDFEFFVDYNYVDVRRGSQRQPFTPRHKLYFTTTYEEEGHWRTGLEAFYTGRQYLPDGREGRDYFIFGLMFEKTFGKFSLIFNVENVLDERQSKYERLVQPPLNHPRFNEIYMPIEGRVANVVLWLKL